MTPCERGVWRWGAVLLASCAAVVALSWAPPGHRATPYWVAHLAATAAMLRAWSLLSRDGSERAVSTVLRVGTVARVMLVAATPFTSTDAPRYLWDGAVLLRGHDPYALPPLASQLASLRATFPTPLDHWDVATCYPPLAEALFALCALTGPALALWSWKALCALASELTVRVTWGSLRGTERAGAVALAAWCPLWLFEAGVGAHVDVFAALAAAVALAAARRGRWSVAALAAGVCLAVKLLPGIVIAPVVWRAPRRVWCAALALAPLAATFGAAELAGMTAPGSLPLMAETWSFASPVWTALYGARPMADVTIRAGLALAGVAGLAWATLRRGRLEAAARGVYGAHLATSTVLYPWYAAPLAAVVPFAPRAWAIALMAALPASYEVLDRYQTGRGWLPARWPVVLIAAAVVVGAVVDVARARRRA